MPTPIIPGIGDIIGRAKDALVAERPSAAPHVEKGIYAQVITGWRGQFNLANAALSDEVQATRLSLTSGVPLRELVANNYDLAPIADAIAPIGEATLARKVVHFLASDPITAPDATDGDSARLLLQAMTDALLAHVASVYDDGLGLGAHQIADDTGTPLTVGTTMGDLKDGANTIKIGFNRHVLNRSVGDPGDPGDYHKDTDPDNAITAADAIASAPGSGFSSNSVAAQQRLLVLANAEKKALNLHFKADARPGIVPNGTTFVLRADPGAFPPVAGGQYRAIQGTYVPPGEQTVTVMVQASLTGPTQNLPLFATGGPSLSVSIQGQLFDARAGAVHQFSLTGIRAAGGLTLQADGVLRKAARVKWRGRWGPTDNAFIAGAIQAGAARIALLTDTDVGRAHVYVVDESWAQSDAWLTAMSTVLRETWRGLGCRLRMGAVRNRLVRVDLTIKLRDVAFLAESDAITARLQEILRKYFDERDDFWFFRLDAIRGRCSIGDPRVLSCNAAKVRDDAGVPIAEPTEPAAGDTLVHWYLADKGVNVTYVGP